MNKNTIVGKKFGRLLVLELDYIKRFEKLTVHYYKCLCDCGKTKSIKRYNITSGTIKSCGCIASEKARDRFLKHGMSKTKVYRIWSSILQRCTNKKSIHNNPKLECYRFTNISKDWEKFDNFYRDMGDLPSNEHQIDRIDPYGNYEKGNCRWVTRSQNMLNQKRNRDLFLYYEKSKKIVPYRLFAKRVQEIGWSLERAISAPKMKNQFG